MRSSYSTPSAFSSAIFSPLSWSSCAQQHRVRVLEDRLDQRQHVQRVGLGDSRSSSASVSTQVQRQRVVQREVVLQRAADRARRAARAPRPATTLDEARAGAACGSTPRPRRRCSRFCRGAARASARSAAPAGGSRRRAPARRCARAAAAPAAGRGSRRSATPAARACRRAGARRCPCPSGRSPCRAASASRTFLPAAALAASCWFSITCSGACATTQPRSSKPLRPARPAICWNSRTDRMAVLLAVELAQLGEQHGADRDVHADAQRVGAADDLEQPLLRQPLDQAAGTWAAGRRGAGRCRGAGSAAAPCRRALSKRRAVQRRADRLLLRLAARCRRSSGSAPARPPPRWVKLTR